MSIFKWLQYKIRSWKFQDKDQGGIKLCLALWQNVEKKRFRRNQRMLPKKSARITSRKCFSHHGRVPYGLFISSSTTEPQQQRLNFPESYGVYRTRGEVAGRLKPRVQYTWTSCEDTCQSVGHSIIREMLRKSLSAQPGVIKSTWMNEFDFSISRYTRPFVYTNTRLIKSLSFVQIVGRKIWITRAATNLISVWYIIIIRLHL